MDEEHGPGDGDDCIGLGGWDELPVLRWPRPLLVSVTALAAIAALTLTVVARSSSATARAGSAGSTAGAAAAPARSVPPPPSPNPSPSSAPSVSSTPSATPTVTSAAPSAVATTSPAAAPAASPPVRAAAVRTVAVASAVTALPGSGTGDIAVAVAEVDGGGGAVATYDSDAGTGDDTYDTASIVKVDILGALLLNAQAADRRLTGNERSLATAMIESSDNDAATALWDAIGGSSGLDDANAKLGLHHTSAGPGELWGLTQTTAADQLKLLRVVFTDDSPLSAASRSYVSGLMGSVITGQRWGVSAADSDDAGYALKNGWLQRSATGLWDINSIGQVTYEGHRLLISVLSSGQRSEGSGIDLVESVATAAAKAFSASL